MRSIYWKCTELTLLRNLEVVAREFWGVVLNPPRRRAALGGEKDIKRFTSTWELCTAGQTTAADSLASNYTLFLPILPSLQGLQCRSASFLRALTGVRWKPVSPSRCLFAGGGGTAVFPRAARLPDGPGGMNRVLATFG